MGKTGRSVITTLKRPSGACSSATTGNLHFAITSTQVCRPDGTSRPRAPLDLAVLRGLFAIIDQT